MPRKLLNLSLLACAALLVAALGYWNLNPDEANTVKSGGAPENLVDFYAHNTYTVQYQADGKLHMALLERLAQRKRDMQLVMDASLTQGLLRLLHQALKTSDWLQVPNLQLLPPHTATQLGQEEPEQAPKDKPRYLN